MCFSIVLFYLLLFTITGAVFGACLLDDYSVTAEYARSEAVVQAHLISQHNVPDKENLKLIGGTIYQVKIEQSFLGTLNGTIKVFSENSSGRFPIRKGKSYLLFLYREAGLLSVDPCGNSGVVSQKTSVLAQVRMLSKTDRKN